MAGQGGMRKGRIKTTCSKCEAKLENIKKRYCVKCASEYNKKWRKEHPLNKDQKIKASIRHKTFRRIQRGTLIPYPCEICGSEKVEAHHDDYRKTYCVRWLCFKHHREYHKSQRETKEDK